MPFFWTEWMKAHGSIAGNRALGSRFGITNRHRFSYPGYAEILTGEPHDEVIDSNDNRRYPFPTVLDILQAPPRAVARSGGRLRLVGDLPLDHLESRGRVRGQRRLPGLPQRPG